MNTHQFEVFLQIHNNIPREGPGDTNSTEEAFRKCNPLPENPEILDIGCGPGFQTIQLAQMTEGNITALDYHEQYLVSLKQKAADLGLESKIKCIRGDMNDMKFANESFDIIWSEGAVYIMGFKEGLKEWRKFLKPGGYLAVTELSWIEKNPPDEIKSYWAENYPDMLTTDQANNIAAELEYEIIDNITLPENAWFENYYDFISKKLPVMRLEFRDDDEALEVIENEETEINMYKQYCKYYGYVFYILRRID